MMDEILTIREVAEYFKLSPTTIWRWCSEGRLPAFKVGRSWRIHRSEVEKIITHNSAMAAEAANPEQHGRPN
ncbi:MAG: helix-turn-helix domain-containing protein [Anaerolineae bacterium]